MQQMSRFIDDSNGQLTGITSHEPVFRLANYKSNNSNQENRITRVTPVFRRDPSGTSCYQFVAHMLPICYILSIASTRVAYICIIQGYSDYTVIQNP